ncbi:MAG: hypothetical protein ACRDWT_18650 [Jatrophihabitantaceae bacterium]
MTRLDSLEDQATATSAGVSDLLKRPIATKPPPPRVLTSVTEQNAVLAGLTVGGPEPRVVLVLNGFAVDAIFAGVRTALITALELARRLDRPLAIVVLEPLGAAPDAVRAKLVDWLTDELGLEGFAERLTLSSQESPRRKDLHPGDLWLVTYWTTAVQVGLLCEDGLVDPDRVVYLVQDWEPGFYPWSTEYALAASTYERGFHLLVNSASLAGFVAEQMGTSLPDLVFAPEVDEERLRSVARAWKPGEQGRPRVLFYARPSKPRNLYALGLAALRRWAEQLPDDVHPIVTCAGEDMAGPDLGPRVTVHNAGKLSFDDYYDLLTNTDVGLALMYSPHPSHLALELPMAGIPTVTNTVGAHRRAWVTGLQVVTPTPGAIAATLSELVIAAGDGRAHEFVGLGDSLGRPLADCVESLITRLPDSITPRAT